MTGLRVFKRTINETNNRHNAQSPKTITAADKKKSYKLTRAATLGILRFL